MAFTNRHVSLDAAPTVSTNNIAVTYEYSEFDQGDPAKTPITLSGTRVRYGADFDSLTSEVNVSRVDAGVVTTTGEVDQVGAGNTIVEIQFVYNVQETGQEVCGRHLQHLHSRRPEPHAGRRGDLRRQQQV